MKRGIILIVGALALLGTVGGGAVYAQDISIVDVPFKFTVHNKVMMPGKYEIKVTDAAVISVMPEKGQALFVPTITRLAQHETPLTNAMLVFDKVGDQYTLSEVWMPSEDGYLVTDTKQPHQHHLLKGKKKTS